MRRVFPLIAALVFLLCSCSADPGIAPLSGTEFMLDTFVTITLYDKPEQELLDGCFELCRELEARLSRTVPGSDIFRLNSAQGQPVELSPDAAAVISAGLRFGELSGGLFDITIAPASGLWDFKAEAPSPPDADALESACRLIGWSRVETDGNTARLEHGMAVDLGGIAKGYIADRMAEWLEERGVRSALLNLGGNIYALGEKPDSSPFVIGIRKPGGSELEYACRLELRGGTAVTSGIYERCFELDGTLYHHILDPRTGYPVQNELASVTIITESSAEADALSTACFALGAERGGELALSLGAQAVLILRDGSIETVGGVTLLPAG